MVRRWTGRWTGRVMMRMVMGAVDIGQRVAVLGDGRLDQGRAGRQSLR